MKACCVQTNPRNLKLLIAMPLYVTDAKFLRNGLMATGIWQFRPLFMSIQLKWHSQLFLNS